MTPIDLMAIFYFRACMKLLRKAISFTEIVPKEEKLFLR